VLNGIARQRRAHEPTKQTGKDQDWRSDLISAIRGYLHASLVDFAGLFHLTKAGNAQCQSTCT
jgi:hypothetical protein